MSYFITFLEGIITFISPCLLPMLPIYISYFTGGGERRMSKTVTNALGVVLGFTAVFVMLGTVAGLAGGFFIKYKDIVNIILGVLVIFFGLNYLGVFKINLFGTKEINSDKKNLGFFSSVLFGIIFSVGWTPCVGAYLSSALSLAAHQGTAVKGMVSLLFYSAGLGIPFLISALLIDSLKSTFNFIKKHYDIINKVCGIFLIIVGVLMATGLLNKFLFILN